MRTLLKNKNNPGFVVSLVPSQPETGVLPQEGQGPVTAQGGRRQRTSLPTWDLLELPESSLLHGPLVN